MTAVFQNHPFRLLPGILALGLCATLSPARAAETDPKGIAFFESKVRPVLVAHCYSCHSAASGKSKGGLRLDGKAAMLTGGANGPALIPGKPEQSLILKALDHKGDLKMPPKGKLPDGAIGDVRQWIAMGAPDPRTGAVVTGKTIDIEAGRRFWAFQPLKRVNPPAVKNEAWVRAPLDRFILAGLEEKQLAPNGPVSKEKLLRRAFYDLWGLPPGPADLDAFLRDTSPDAFTRVIERLLASPHYGERWGRHWLDVVRFAESGGYEFDGDRAGAYNYRDFVIKALNQDMPYDQFVRLQLGGDRLQPDDFQAVSASGFLVAGPFPGQTTVRTQELIRYDHLDDMLATTCSAMLGLTIGCARCHDHKFDPLPQHDYYRLLACLGRTDSASVKVDPTPEVYRKAKADFDRGHTPLLTARERFEKDDLPGRLAQLVPAGPPAATWLVLDTVSAAGKAATFTKLDDGSLLARAGKSPGAETYTLVAHTHQKGITGLRLEALADPSLPKNGPGQSAEGSFLLTDCTLSIQPLTNPGKTAPTMVKLRAAKASHEAMGHPLAAAVDADKKTGWSIAGQPGKAHAGIFEMAPMAGFEGGTILTLTLSFGEGQSLGRLRLGLSTSARPVSLTGDAMPQAGAELRTIMQASAGKLTEANRAAVRHWVSLLDPKARQIETAIADHGRLEPKPNLQTIFAASSGRGGDVHFLIRGEVERKNGVAPPGFLQVLTTAPRGEQQWLDAKALDPRVALGKWMTDPDQGAGQLLARVIVNRLWQHHFGQGLVRTPNDFGNQGERPTHPELLDYLAGELIRGGWKLKAIHHLIMTSAVYQQGGEASLEALRNDPANRFWSHRPAPAGGRGHSRCGPGGQRYFGYESFRAGDARRRQPTPQCLPDGQAQPADPDPANVRRA